MFLLSFLPSPHSKKTLLPAWIISFLGTPVSALISSSPGLNAPLLVSNLADTLADRSRPSSPPARSTRPTATHNNNLIAAPATIFHRPRISSPTTTSTVTSNYAASSAPTLLSTAITRVDSRTFTVTTREDTSVRPRPKCEHSPPRRQNRHGHGAIMRRGTCRAVKKEDGTARHGAAAHCTALHDSTTSPPPPPPPPPSPSRPLAPVARCLLARKCADNPRPVNKQ